MESISKLKHYCAFIKHRMTIKKMLVILSVLFLLLSVIFFVINCSVIDNLRFFWRFFLVLSFLFLHFRFTFYFSYRVLPNLAISLAFGILLCCVLSCTPSLAAGNIWGAEILTSSNTSEAILDGPLLKITSGSILGSAIFSLIAEASKDLWSNLYKDNGENHQIKRRFMQLRRRLLTHRFFPSIRNITLVRLFFFLFIEFAVFILILLKKSSVSLSILEQSLFLALTLGLFGFATHRFISEEELLRAQCRYIESNKTCSLPEQYMCSDNSRNQRWQDFCQVIVNIYCSHCGSLSEENYYHQLSIVEGYLSELESKTLPNCCEFRIVADVVSVYDMTIQLYINPDETSQAEKDSFEQIFAADIYSFLINRCTKTNLSKTSINIKTCSSAGVLLFAINCLLDYQKNAWKSIIVGNSASFEDFRNLVLLDFLRWMFEQHRQGSPCQLSWFCDRKDSIRDQDERRAALLLELPFIVEKHLHGRYLKDAPYLIGTAERPSAFRERVEEYYWNVFCKIENTYTLDQCQNIGAIFHSFLLTSYEESKYFLQRILPVINTNVQNVPINSIILTGTEIVSIVSDNDRSKQKPIAQDVPGWKNLINQDEATLKRCMDTREATFTKYGPYCIDESEVCHTLTKIIFGGKS